jgi:hypothetical protein
LFEAHALRNKFMEIRPTATVSFVLISVSTLSLVILHQHNMVQINQQ